MANEVKKTPGGQPKKRFSKVVRAFFTAVLSAILLSICSFIDAFGFRETVSVTDAKGKTSWKGAGATPLTFFVTFLVVLFSSWLTSVIVAALNKAAISDSASAKSNESNYVL